MKGRVSTGKSRKESWCNEGKWFLEAGMGVASMMWMKEKGKGYSESGIACWL